MFHDVCQGLLDNPVDGNPLRFRKFRGHARFDAGTVARRTVYDNAPEGERNLDKERKGRPLIIDLDSVDGMMPGAMLKMRRA
jgi:hypothetical protein